MKPVKIAQVGTMHDHARSTFRTLKNNPDYFDVVGLARVSEDKQDPVYEGVREFTVEELLAMEDLEAVTIETAEERATEFAQLFADKGIAVHMDKPGSPDIAAFERLADTLEAHGAAMSMGYMYRFNPAVMELFERIRSGELGEIYAVEAHMSVHHPADKHRWLKKYPGGMMYFLGCHLVDLVYSIMGEPEEVLCLNAATGKYDPESLDYGFAVFKYRSGCPSFIKSCAAEINGVDRRQLVVCGTKGTVEIKPFEIGGSLHQHTLYRVTREHEEKDIWADNAHSFDTGYMDRYAAMMRSFAECVRGKENPYTYDYEKRLFRLLMKCCGGEARV